MQIPSPVLQLRVSASDGVPIYLQIVNGVRFLVASGRLAAGDELPPIRLLAERLVVNPNTVARAYRELQAAGVVENRRTTGTFVAEHRPVLTEAERRRLLTERVDALLMEARQLDLDVALVLDLVRERDARLSERPASEGAPR